MHSITGKLNKPARIFQAGESTGFGIRLGIKYRDPKTKQDEWTNYSAVIFAKSPGQIQFYTDVLVEGAIVEVSAEQLKIDQFDGDNGPILTIDMLNTRLGYVNAPQGAGQQQNQGGFQQNNQQQSNSGFQGQQQGQAINTSNAQFVQQGQQNQGGFNNQQQGHNFNNRHGQ